MKYKVNDTNIKDEKVTTNFEATNPGAGINERCFETKIAELNIHNSFREKTFHEYVSHNSKLSIEEVLIERAVKAAVQLPYDKGLFDNYDNADGVLEGFFVC